MMNNALLDANVLIAAFDKYHRDHIKAVVFVNSLEIFFTTPQVQGAFLRFFSRPWTDADGKRREPRMTTQASLAYLESIVALERHRFLSDDFPYPQISMLSLSGFKQWNDAYLIAQARKNGLMLCTLERKLNNMDDPGNPVLFVIP